MRKKLTDVQYTIIAKRRNLREYSHEKADIRMRFWAVISSEMVIKIGVYD